MKKHIKAGVLFGLMAVLAIGTYMYSILMIKSISEKVVRLHVVADNDSPKAQELKLKVRDEVLNRVSEYLSYAKDKEEAVNILSTRLEEITDISENTIEEEGMDYSVHVRISEESFPTKSYGAFCFPAGRYTALKVSIGRAEGKNWWCVMFPPLCLTEEAMEDDGYEALSRVLSEKDMGIVDRRKGKTKPVTEVKFFIVEKWQELLG